MQKIWPTAGGLVVGHILCIPLVLFITVRPSGAYNEDAHLSRASDLSRGWRPHLPHPQEVGRPLMMGLI